MESRLKSALLVGADVIVNCNAENLRDKGSAVVVVVVVVTIALVVSLFRASYKKVFFFVVMEETGGNGVGRLFEATGSAAMINNCFSLLRYNNKNYN